MTMIVEEKDIFETYGEIISGCYPPEEAAVKLRCAKYFSEYRKRKAALVNFGATKFFTGYFMRWLPDKVCMEENSVIDAFYPSADEFVRLSDTLTGNSEYDAFKMIDRRVKYESARLMHLKKNIMTLNNSFIISKIPCIIDFDRYREKRNSSPAEKDSGLFRVAELFSENSAVLDRLDGGYFIRLFFDASVMGLIRKGDLLDIDIGRREGGRWRLEEIKACYAPEKYDRIIE